MIDIKKLALGLTLTLLGLVAAKIWDRYLSPSAEILFWDVGQGDSILLKMPKGQTYLVDTGGGWRKSRIGEELAGELADKAILHLNGLILSHLDSDHAGGTLGLYRKIKIDQVVYPKAFHGTFHPLLKQIHAEAQSRKVAMNALFQDQFIEGNDFKVRLSSMSAPSVKTNNLGLWVELEVYGCRFLLTGDMEKEAENKLLSQIKPPYHVLKVAHHGSLTSSQRSFLKQVLPVYSVVSVGEDNSYGHPKFQVLERLRYFKTQILRTDFHGFVSFKVNPDGNLLCTHALGSCGQIQCRI